MGSKRSTERLFTEQQVAELLREDVGVVQILRRTGRLKVSRVGSSYMVSESALSSYYRKYRHVPPPSVAAMNRRKFLRLGAYVAEVVAIYGFYESVKLVNLDRPRADREADEYFGGIFGRVSHDRAFGHSMGRQRFSGPSRHHPDNWAAGVGLAPAIGLAEVPPERYRHRDGDPLPVAGDLFIFGGSNSTEETAVAWEFEGDDDRHLARRTDPLIPLRWWGLSDSNHPKLRDTEPVAFHMEGVTGSRAAIGWPLIDRFSDELVGAPATNRRDTIVVNDRRVRLVKSNFVLLTRLPNYLDPDFAEVADKPNEWPHMLVVEGGNGIGTRAAELLATASGLAALHDASVALDGAHEFQVRFEAYDVDLDLRGFHRFRSIRYVDSYRLPRTTPYAAASDYAQRRLASPTLWQDDGGD